MNRSAIVSGALAMFALLSGCVVRARPVYVRTGVVVAAPATTVVAPAGVVLLGERVVNFAVDRDVLPLAARPEMFRGLYMDVVGGGIEMLDCDVTFENGQRIDLPVRQYLAPGSRTRAFDFPGAQRNIARVTLVYRTVTAGTGRAVVRVWGIP